MQGQFTFTASDRRRDAKLAAVEANSDDWAPLAKTQFKLLAGNVGFREAHLEFMGEDIRHWLTPFVGKPHRPEAWGALVSSFVKKGLIVYVRHDKPKDLKSNSSRKPVYKWGIV